MPELLKRYWKQLEVYNSIKNPRLKKLLLSEFVKDFGFCKLLRQIARNTLKKTFQIEPYSLRRLRKRKNSILKLARKYKTQRKQRTVAVQSGSGILPIVIPLLASVIGSLIDETH